jgi:hypothetical protein
MKVSELIGEAGWGNKLFAAMKDGKLDGMVVTAGIEHATGVVSDPTFIKKAWNTIGLTNF